MVLRKGWLLLLGLLGACGLPSPDQARKNLAPETPLTPEYRDIPLARIHLGVSDLYPLLFGESENVRLFAVGEGEGQGRIRPGDVALEIGVPNFSLAFFVSASELNRPVTKAITLPQIPGVNPRLQNLLEQAQLPEAYLFQTLTLTLPVGYVRARDIAVCLESACSASFREVSTGNTAFRFNTNAPVRVVAEASEFLNALGTRIFQGNVDVDLRLTPLADLGDLIDYVGQEGCGITGCNIRQNVTEAKVLAPFGARAPDPFVVETEALASPLGALPTATVEEVKRYTQEAGLTLEIASSLPTEVLEVTLWAGSGDTPRFDNPLPQDFLYTTAEPIPAASVDEEGRSTNSVKKTISVMLSGAELQRFLGLLSQEDVHVAARLTLKGPDSTGGVFRYKASDALRIFAKGTARLRIGR